MRHASQFFPLGKVSLFTFPFSASPPINQVRRLWSQWPERGDAWRCTEQTTLCQSFPPALHFVEHVSSAALSQVWFSPEKFIKNSVA